MLVVNLADLGKGPITVFSEFEPTPEIRETWPAGFDGLLCAKGQVERSGDRQSYRWKGTIEGTALGECRRCLTRVATPLRIEVDAVFTTDQEAADDPGVYWIPELSRTLDLAPVVREELGLAVPAFPLCKEDCAGLCHGCGADLNEGPCGCDTIPVRD